LQSRGGKRRLASERGERQGPKETRRRDVVGGSYFLGKKKGKGGHGSAVQEKGKAEEKLDSPACGEQKTSETDLNPPLKKKKRPKQKVVGGEKTDGPKSPFRRGVPMKTVK